MSKLKETGFWTFFCNPKYWPVDEFLFENTEDLISQYRITTWQKDMFEEGQLGVIRVGNDSRTKKALNGRPKLERGIYAVVRILGVPFEQERSSAFVIKGQKNSAARLMVPIRYIRNYIERPVLLQNLENDPIIRADPYLLNGIQAASMPLVEDAFNRILLYGEEGS